MPRKQVSATKTARSTSDMATYFDPRNYSERRAPRIRLSPGDLLKTMRELQELTQTELAKLSGVPQTAISAIEANRVALGPERAAKLAPALKMHPGSLLWPHWWDDHPINKAAAE